MIDAPYPPLSLEQQKTLALYTPKEVGLLNGILYRCVTGLDRRTLEVFRLAHEYRFDNSESPRAIPALATVGKDSTLEAYVVDWEAVEQLLPFSVQEMLDCLDGKKVDPYLKDFISRISSRLTCPLDFGSFDHTPHYRPQIDPESGKVQLVKWKAHESYETEMQREAMVINHLKKLLQNANQTKPLYAILKNDLYERELLKRRAMVLALWGVVAATVFFFWTQTCTLVR